MSTIPQILQLALHYQQLGEWQSAETLLRQVLQGELHNNNEFCMIAYTHLGMVLTAQDRTSEALECYQRAVVLNPQDARAHYNLGNLLREQKQWQEAIDCYQQAIRLNPTLVEAYNNLGNVWRNQNQLAEAVACFQKALTVNPTHAKTYYNLGMALTGLSKFTEALTCYQRALTLNSNYAPQIYHGQGVTLYYQGKIPEAITSFKKAVAMKPTYTNAHSNLLMALNYTTEYNRATMFIEHQQFNEQQAKPLAVFIKPHHHDHNPQRQLKIGYVSQDFRKHSVAYFIEPILAHHDPRQVEIYCYYNNFQPLDETTERLQQYTAGWRNCLELSDEALAEQIREDKIDILVDLTGHTGYNRLLVFARQPAPVQVTYLGYSNTTGLTAIDYRLTDGYADPEGIADPFSSETLVRMPHSYFCYSPADETLSAPLSPLPALTNNYLTFGSFNNCAKLSPEILNWWGQLLTTLPDAKLLVKSKSLEDTSTRQALQDHFARYGITLDRLILTGFAQGMNDHLRVYSQVDIALDSFPYNGATTTCESLWMGIPVVTLVGETHVARMGLSILSTVGLTELIATTPEEYLNICINLANQKEHLQRLRATMRERLQASPLMDAASFTHHLETVYRAMWEKWIMNNE